MKNLKSFVGLKENKMTNRIMIDHLGRNAQRGMYLAKNKERIEREGKHCDNCNSLSGPYDICDLTGKEHKPEDVCKYWENNSLYPLIELSD